MRTYGARVSLQTHVLTFFEKRKVKSPTQSTGHGKVGLGIGGWEIEGFPNLVSWNDTYQGIGFSRINYCQKPLNNV